ncbi:MAG: Gfo/Idh/MocA family oxidoreductase, partial [Planctomycetales bacterium]|nr:Gfo/Idh/MocA family oxidoreductase [Planctomycetales bacterium]NIP71419.1 Gfo/Idh/MocA family oxidoreductase [Planctomycetales bacterium]
MTDQRNRRDFLKRTAAATAAASVPYVSWTQQAFANREKNDRPMIGCIGLGGHGTRDARELSQFGDIVAVCDVDTGHAQRAKNDQRIGKGKADAYGDYRQLLDRNDIDVVSIVTPDHWHIKIALEALQAGKHVFCQKPLTLTLEENQLIRDACRRHADQVFVIGTQQRSDHRRFLRAINMVQKGMLGDIKTITCGINGGPQGGPFPKQDPPAELDWNMWLGPAPLVDYIRKRCHGTFRWWYEYSGGKFSDWGAHHVDIATWALGEDKEGQGPIEIDGTDAKHPVPLENGYPTVDDQYNTAQDFAVKCKYASGVEVIVTSRGDNGCLIEGSRGRIFVSRGKITGKPIEEDWDAGFYGQEDLQRLCKGKPFEGHKNNFFRCIREGGLPVSDVYSHVQTMNTCHLAAIAARLGRV